MAAWFVNMTKTTTGWKAVITLRSSATGTLRLRVTATDANGAVQASELAVPLH